MKTKSIGATFLIFISISAGAQIESSIDGLKEKYIKVKESIVRNDTKQRLVMGKLYGLNSRIKKMSKKRGVISDKVMSANSNARLLANDINQLTKRIEQQRDLLSVRLRYIYKMGMNGKLQIIFSSSNAHDFDRNLKFLKILSNKDFALIKNLNENLEKRIAQEKKLKRQVAKLIKLKKSLKKQEGLLESEKKMKSRLLGRLRAQTAERLKKLKGIKRQAIQDVLEDSFFENKGELKKPIKGVLVKGYSLIQDEDFKYSIAHKGHFYQASIGTEVKAIYSGEVAFLGELPGYGKSIVLDHGDHYYSVYANLDRLMVKAGANIKTGDVIAQSAESKTGMGTGLYFEVRHFSDAIDPSPWLKFNNTALLK